VPPQPPPVNHHILESIAEEPSFVEDDELNNSLISFQNFLQDDPDPQEFSDSDPYQSHDSADAAESDNEPNKIESDMDMDLESDNEELERLQRLMPRTNPRNMSKRKPGPKRSSSRQAEWSNMDDVNDPCTCGTLFLFLALHLSLFH